MLNFFLRAVLLLMGLVFAASLAVAVLLLMAFWALGAGWARLTGRPVTPWVMRFDPRAGFEQFRAAAARQTGPSPADVANARARGESAGSPVASAPVPRAEGVTDVQARPVSRGE